MGERGCSRSDLPQSYPSSRAEATLVMTDTWPFGTESGFPKFPKIKYLGGDSVSGKAVHAWHFFSKNLFSKMICRIWTFWFRLRTVTNLRVLSCSDPNMNRTGARSSRGVRARLQFLATLLGNLESLTRTRDILF